MEEETPSGYFNEFATLGLLDEKTLSEINEKTHTKEGELEKIDQQITTQTLIDNIPITFAHMPRKGLSFQIWPSAIALAKYFSFQVRQKLITLGNKTILELGSGTGFLGTFLALLGGTAIVTDLGKTVDNMKTTLWLNGFPVKAESESLKAMLASLSSEQTKTTPAGRASAIELDWCHHPSKADVLHWFQELNPGSSSIDIICATDCVYERTLHDDLMNTLLLLCDPNTEVYFANVKRSAFLFFGLISALLLLSFF